MTQYTEQQEQKLNQEALNALALAKDSQSADGALHVGSNRPFNAFRTAHPDFAIDFQGFDFTGISLQRKETFECGDVSAVSLDLRGCRLETAINLHQAKFDSLERFKGAIITPDQAAKLLTTRGIVVQESTRAISQGKIVGASPSPEIQTGT